MAAGRSRNRKRGNSASSREIASTDVLTVEALTMRTGITAQAQDLIDRLGNDRAAMRARAATRNGQVFCPDFVLLKSKRNG
jgi:hypothetical protein